MQDLRPDIPMAFRSIALSARLIEQAKKAGLDNICRATLAGKTPNEPQPNSVTLLRDLETYGFHIHKGMMWGLHRNSEPGKGIELVRLLDAGKWIEFDQGLTRQ